MSEETGGQVIEALAIIIHPYFGLQKRKVTNSLHAIRPLPTSAEICEVISVQESMTWQSKNKNKKKIKIRKS